MKHLTVSCSYVSIRTLDRFGIVFLNDESVNIRRFTTANKINALGPTAMGPRLYVTLGARSCGGVVVTRKAARAMAQGGRGTGAWVPISSSQPTAHIHHPPPTANLVAQTSSMGVDYSYLACTKKEHRLLLTWRFPKLAKKSRALICLDCS